MNTYTINRIQDKVGQYGQLAMRHETVSEHRAKDYDYASVARLLSK